jgi:polar amino acid transport system substrate-binding protein
VTQRLLLAAVVPLAAATVVACTDASSSNVASVLDALPQAPTTVVTTTSAPATTTGEQACVERGLATASLRPDPDALAGRGPSLDEIRERGRLIVGVDENTLGFSWRDPSSGEIEGFEVGLAEAIAARIFGGDAASRLDLVPVVTEQKFDFVSQGVVDMTISANSMTCSRWAQVAFSTEYYTAHQQFLVREASPIGSVADLDGKTVCVTTKSSSIGILDRLVPEAKQHTERDRTGCLLALEEGDVDAYFGHDSFLYGMELQDPHVDVRELLPPDDTVSHYGIAVASGRPDLVRFVNVVLDEARAPGGAWASLHHQLEEEIGVPPADPPQPRYRD